MTAQNRVTPTGEVVAIPLRGRFMGIRGRIHDGQRIVRPYEGRRWLVCDKDFRGRRVTQWWRNDDTAPPVNQVRRFTMLFFHDEAVAFAAGHRPCGECRHARYAAYRDAWASARGGGRPSADDIDRRLHQERLDGRRQRHHAADWADLPDGTFVLLDGGRPALVWDDAVVPWTVGGYGIPVARPARGPVVVLTPPATVAVLRAGYRPVVAARRARSTTP